MTARDHYPTTPNFSWRIVGLVLALLFFRFTAQPLHAEKAITAPTRELIAPPYSVNRYTGLWTSPCFHRPALDEHVESTFPRATTPSVCKYALEGIAESNGIQYVYLCEKNTGITHELIPRQAMGNLEVLKVVLGDQPSNHKVSIRLDNETYLLEFDLTENTVASATQSIERLPASPQNSSKSSVKPVPPRDAIESKRRTGKDDEGDWIDDPAPSPAGGQPRT